LLTLKVILLSDLYVTNAKTKRKKKKEWDSDQELHLFSLITYKMVIGIVYNMHSVNIYFFYLQFESAIRIYIL
jgi:hypothetical protein